MENKTYTYDDKFRFTEDWFSGNIPAWRQIIDHVRQEREIKDVLTIGVYEGRCTTFLSDEVLGKGCTYTAVDTFGGTLEEPGMKGTAERLKEGDFIYDNFMHNISFFPDIEYTVHRGRSEFILPQLVKEGKQFDAIYIDGSHRADDTLVDAYYAHKLLRPSGWLAFDDLAWGRPDMHIVERPEFGIRAFVTMYEDQYQVIGHGYQLHLVKKAEWDESKTESYE